MPANDIDVLVAPRQREVAVRALLKAGFALRPEPENISHEISLVRGPLTIDLHWDILRPGRTRHPMADQLLARRVRINELFYGLHDTDAVFLMLVHPAFARYVSSPNVALASVADVLLWLDKRTVDWDALAAQLDAMGVRAAAWMQQNWIAMLVDTGRINVPHAFLDRIRPGPLRRWYLRWWLRHDLSSRLLSKPLLIQAGLTLLLHDRASDAVRALRGWWNGRRLQATDPLLVLAKTTSAVRPAT
jgi:hypothetical protein